MHKFYLYLSVLWFYIVVLSEYFVHRWLFVVYYLLSVCLCVFWLSFTTNSFCNCLQTRTNYIMFFFPPQDDYPLASLPLLGYSVTIPSESENIHKDYVFKLHFKSHVYYFRSESEYTFERYRCTFSKYIYSVVGSWMSEDVLKAFLCLQVDGGHPQCHGPLQWCSCPEQQRVPSSLSWLTSFPHAISLSLCLSVSGGICPSCPPGLSAFLFYTYLGHLYMCPCTFGAF